jgi:4-hydroxythreonine-4-phosphate dehydrogenase
MKVFVSQGHEEGIGLEVFFKSCLFLSTEELHSIRLIAFPNGVKETLISLQLPFTLDDEFIHLCHVKIAVTWMDHVDHSQSFSALKLGMLEAEAGGVLYTLPTSKDQFPGFAGHTEYFRHFYYRSDLGMFFSSPSIQMLLVTDHVAVNDLSQIITEERLSNCLLTAIECLTKWNWPLTRIFVAGLNPHAGEGGLIGKEDVRIANALKRVSDKTKIDITGPYPGDTMVMEQRDASDLLVYLFHDQGLGLFKGLQGLIGSNITLGLPYPRLSPDHGTSFSLFGKNSADYRGCLYSLRQALNLLRTIDGQDSSYQGKSSQSKKH